MVGKTLSHYRILEELGRGGMGIVYRAEDTRLDRIVAVKVLPASALLSEDDRARFYREAKSAAQLHHPHIAAVFEIDEVTIEGLADEGKRPFIAMEFIDGESLQERIRSGPMRIEESVRIAAQVAHALEAAHDKNIVHRDIKAANVMMTSKGEAKVLDFGLAKTTHATLLTRTGSTVGTAAYMSPEQARGDEVDHRSDLWSLGVLLYEMVAGGLPFRGDYEQAITYSILNEQPDPLTAIRTGVPMGLEWIVTKLLAKSPGDRYQSAEDLIVDLRTVDLTTTGMSRTSTSGTKAVATGGSAKPQKMPPIAWAVIGALAVALLWLLFPSSNTVD
ncbi:MAG: serine/threonine-protein kinase, partial [Rhodothermales bacterium]|nr:serine/threonine-protein kinase [Rhodothermales bacterium]